jgi:tripartite-type tricarboxylate transporter receptor subunit TctC
VTKVADILSNACCQAIPCGRNIGAEPRRGESTMVRAAGAVALLALGALGIAPAAAQETAGAAAFPSRAIHIVVPFPAGGPADIAARLIGQKMSEDWGAPVVVDNRPGANTIIGAQVVARAAPDGYTLLMVIDSTLTMNQYLYRTLPYDPLADFAPITPKIGRAHV